MGDLDFLVGYLVGLVVYPLICRFSKFVMKDQHG